MPSYLVGLVQFKSKIEGESFDLGMVTIIFVTENTF